MKPYLESRLLQRIDKIRGGTLLLLLVMAMLSSPREYVVDLSVNYGVLLLVIIGYYVILYRQIHDSFFKDRPARLAKHVQTLLNMVIITFLVHYTGGVDSYFNLAYVFEIIVAAFILDHNECFIEATFAWLLYAGLLTLHFNELLPHYPLPGIGASAYMTYEHVFPAVIRLMVFLYLAAFIGNYLNQLFHERGEELEKLANKLSELSLQLKELAITDGLTGLYNYRYFKQKLLDEVLRSKRYGRIVSVVMIDLDNFKCINDTYGHPAGDKVLKEVSVIFKTSVRAVDTVARYGGEEFTLILPETDTDGAFLVSERIRSRVESLAVPVSPAEPGPLKITMSAGIATFPKDAAAPEALVEKADRALYLAKHTGKNATIKYCESEHAES